jgi:hypothetical protein
MTPEQPTPTRSAGGQAAVIRPGADGQETMGGPTGQTPTGRKVDGQQTPRRPGSGGQDTAWTPSEGNYRPNR